MSNYMTLEEFHQRLGKWIRENPEHKNKLLAEAAIADSDNFPSYIPGSMLLSLANKADDEGFEKEGTLQIVPPKTSEYVM